MKKVIALILLAALLCVGCGETAPAETVSELEVPASETFAEDILAEDTPADMVADGADKE